MSNKQSIHFISMADDGFIVPLKISIQQAIKYYPDATYSVYDLGLSTENKNALKSISSKITFVTWVNLHHPVRTHYSSKVILLKAIGFLADLINRNRTRTHSFLRQYDLEIQYLNKIYCIRDYAKTSTEPFIYLDADAFITGRIDEVLSLPADIAVTVRKQSELEYAFNKCKLLNAGVLFFLGEKKQIQKFIDIWTKKAESSQEHLAEQSSLSRLLLESNSDFFSIADAKATVEGVHVQSLPCIKYNYNWIENYETDVEKQEIKIIHLKSGRFKTELFKKLARKLNLKV